MTRCTCYWCTKQLEHPDRHKRWIVVSPIDNVPAVSCYTCGHIEQYDPAKHVDVLDIG